MSTLLDQALAAIRAKRPDIEKRFGIRLVGVVGSVARGEEKPTSDIDIIFDQVGSTTLFKVIKAEHELEDYLGRKIDLVQRQALRPDQRAFIERDLVTA